MVSAEIAAMRGTWKLPNSSVTVEIRLSGDGVQVRAIDQDDGEELLVEEICVEQGRIGFYLVTPSTRWTVHKEIKAEENGSLLCVTTLVDNWERIS